MEYPKKRPSNKLVIASLAIVVIVVSAIFIYLGAFVLQKLPKTEAAPGIIKSRDNGQSGLPGPQFHELPGASVQPDQPRVEGEHTETTEPHGTEDNEHGRPEPSHHEESHDHNKGEKEPGLLNRLGGLL